MFSQISINTESKFCDIYDINAYFVDKSLQLIFFKILLI